MKRPHLILASLALSAPSAVLAAEPTTPATTAAPAKPASDPDRQICKMEEQIGSLIARNKICLTAAQWKERSFRQGQWVEHQSTYNSQPNGR